ncbi:MAG: hypothetical protein SGBAC_005935 [Bacillariaceae sp.]
MKASTKTEKGHVIIDIVERIRRDSPTGVGLVRQNKQTGRWFYIGLEKAKDKVGHALRKASLEKSRSQSQEKKTPRKQQYPSTDSLTTAASSSTSPSPTPISSVSLPSSPAHNHPAKYEEGAPMPYYPQYDEAYHRAYQHYHYSAYHHHYPTAAAQDPATHDTGAHRGYDVYYPFVGAHAYAPADYSPEAASHHHHPHHHHRHYASTPPGRSHLPGSGETNLYSPVIHSPVTSEH